MASPGDQTEIEDLDDYADLDEPEPTRSSVFQPAPLSLSGLIIACVSFLSNAPLDNAIDARLYGSSVNVGTRIAELAERTAITRIGIALIGLAICGVAIYLDDVSDPAWGRTAARAGVVVALVALVVYAVALLLGGTAHNPITTNP